MTRVWPRLDAEAAVRDLLGDQAALAALLPDIAAQDRARLASAGDGWTLADLPLLDEARVLIDGPPEVGVGHVVVDEAQQLTEMQWRAVFRRCASRSLTVVGDLAQAGPVSTVRSWAEALSPFVGERFAHHRLTVNYRTTAEILEATVALLAQIAPEQAVSTSIRHGEAPSSVETAEAGLAGRLRELLTEVTVAHPGELIGVIAAADRCRSLAWVGEVGGTVLVAAPDARGLEFDTVVIVDPEGIAAAGEAGLRDLYVAQTRPTQRLVMLTVR
ncbi:hypothetical protein [Nocardioides sp.]|uniref:hypothetical protein n=1 Tax=Nocardioides sp. TaxID=35761 RepID=UPI00260B3309|nr:hypothetical protein [Nocardioides sp.]